ncbi:MAG TPA: hypothetical protein VF454_00170 [Gemmatimonadales bacterium]
MSADPTFKEPIMRAVALLMLFAAPLAAQYPATPAAPAAGHAADPDHMVQGNGLPAGWNGRTDRGQPLAGAKFEAMGAGFHVTTGPAVILWRDADRANGAFHTLATFTQVKNPAHPEAFGMFVAGSNLDSASQSYIYVLVRGDGAYLIKRRVGATVTAIVDWTPSPAVNKADSAGKATNKIELQNTDGHLTFTINGQQVHSMDIPVAETRGIVGLRVNHNLEVHVEGFAVHNIR